MLDNVITVLLTIVVIILGLVICEAIANAMTR